MKFQIFSFLLSTLSLPHADAAEVVAMASPQCVNFEPIKMVGDATFVGADPESPVPAVGDMSIGSYVGVPKQTRSVEQDDFANQGVPEQPGGFTEIDLSYDSECVVTAATFGAPTCSYLFKMVFCREKNKGSIRKDACRLGSFSAYGKGPSKIHITGGTDDFVGAFGEITTTTDFDQGDRDPVTGDLRDSSVEMKVKLCYHEDSEKRKILDLFPRVQAADFDTQNGVRIGKGGAYIGYIADGDYIGYKQINFGPSGSTKSILFHYARINNGGNAKFRIGSSNGTLIGDTLVLPSTGSYDNYETLKVTLNQDVAGLNDLYIVGRSFNYEWFELSDLE